MGGQRLKESGSGTPPGSLEAAICASAPDPESKSPRLSPLKDRWEQHSFKKINKC